MGYLAVFSLENRNNGITNLNNSRGEPIMLAVDITPGTLPNSSPEFSDKALMLVCLGDTSTILNKAYDADGAGNSAGVYYYLRQLADETAYKD